MASWTGLDYVPAGLTFSTGVSWTDLYLSDCLGRRPNMSMVGLALPLNQKQSVVSYHNRTVCQCFTYMQYVCMLCHYVCMLCICAYVRCLRTCLPGMHKYMYDVHVCICGMHICRHAMHISMHAMRICMWAMHICIYAYMLCMYAYVVSIWLDPINSLFDSATKYSRQARGKSVLAGPRPLP